MKEYYTPKYEDFYPGFEFEYRAIIRQGVFGQLMGYTESFSDAWSKGVFAEERDRDSWHWDGGPSLHEIKTHIANNAIRVKKIDRSDMIECGFKECSTIPSRPCFKKGIYFVRFLKPGFLEIVDIHNHDDRFFKGRIKNKSEFKKVIEQITL